MLPLSSLTKKDIENVKLLSFDVDGVTIERGTEVSEKGMVLTVKTKVVSSRLLEKIGRLKKHFYINFTSGRSLLYLARMFAPLLWDRVTLQGENGLFTLVDGQVIQTDQITAAELEKTEMIRREIGELARVDVNIKGFEPKQFMITVHSLHEDEQIENIVRGVDTAGEFYFYWISGEAYDIFLKRFNKASGLKFLTESLGLSMSQVLAVGNDVNDKSVVEGAGVGVTTSKDDLEAHYYTEEKYNLGGEEVVDRLLEIVG
ncbi:MAG: HAD hydrolase family protein [Candidatus Blackburnbacteria bacterium]|nr:HAD hydrolase family protein [Candidatus Blackburnbacteria bacterium]